MNIFVFYKLTFIVRRFGEQTRLETLVVLTVKDKIYWLCVICTQVLCLQDQHS